MKAITYQFETDQFHLNEIDIPEIGKNEILVKVKACGINPVDAKIKFWKGAIPEPVPSPYVVGLDVVGEVVKMGKKVKGFAKGDEVFYHGNMFKPHGGLAEYAVHDYRTVFHKPYSLKNKAAAAAPCAGWTAWRALVEKLKVNEGDKVLIIGAAGGVGSYAVQIAKHVCKAKKVIAVASSQKHDYLKSLGADEVIDYKNTDVVAKVKELTKGKGVSKSFDCVGDDNDIIAANSLTFNGEMLELVGVVRPDKYDNVFSKNITFHQLALGAAHGFDKNSLNTIIDAANGLTDAMLNGKVKTPQLITVDFEGAIETLNSILDRKITGKVVLKI
ncbi:zinc-binding dehydrogenase [Flammeovirga yaeyamensis]|uniref:Zinc-binding dehydrogenase n=1 Tax=Flammeovirga yaeyamensis TaxID=367791 RepID=A0AAX1N8W5_9BACT|nr:zinc-binding dehydrogenase [Flammeovirga yaeyamensis]MBB3701281.1 NADPH:quinone reductase-like Zn-dependent oxidoreductase [Flammeovirga yaeyamensis]NMF38249.1 zinc-binding dehydrogenase [Flammeovirga yaeyamensis]QWG02660.1 zinc-binding dehydrogenase [Flammeovirga yaeyamensis]